MPSLQATSGGIQELCSHPENDGARPFSIWRESGKTPAARLTEREQNRNIVAFASRRICFMPSHPKPDEPDDTALEAAVDQAITACGGDFRATIRALIVANDYLRKR